MTQPQHPAPGIDFQQLAALVEELRRRHDPRRSVAEQAEYLAMAEKYPGQFVAFFDQWDGEKLTREVVAAAPTVNEFHRFLGAYPHYEARRREIGCVHFRDRDDAIEVPSVWFEPEPETDFFVPPPVTAPGTPS